MGIGKLLTTPEVAERTGRDLRTVQWWIQQGMLPVQKVGRDNFIHEDDLKLVAGLKRGRPPTKATPAEKPNTSQQGTGNSPSKGRKRGKK